MTSGVQFNAKNFPPLGEESTHTKKDYRYKPAEENDIRFLQRIVSAYKKILRDNGHLLDVSATFRPHTLNKFDLNLLDSEKDDPNHDIMDIMAQWNTEYHHAQKVLNVCRSEFRVWLTKQIVIKNSGDDDVLGHYNLDFQNFKTISAQKPNPVMNPAKWFKKKNEDQSSQMYVPIEFYIDKIYYEEREFLKNVIQKFVELVEKELHDDYGPNLTESLGLIEFEFESDDVQAWASLYNSIKNKEDIVWPKLPPLCYFPYSNDPQKPRKFNDTASTFKKENEYVYNKFNIFKIKYNNSAQTRNKKWIQNELGLRIWFHARAWLAFRKAIQSELIKPDGKDDYMKKNRIQTRENKYLVLGSTMALALPAASRSSYLVSFERS
jgi:hypothetical protein